MKKFSIFMATLFLVSSFTLLGVAGTTQTPSKKVQTPSLTIDLSSDYELCYNEAREVVGA